MAWFRAEREGGGGGEGEDIAGKNKPPPHPSGSTDWEIGHGACSIHAAQQLVAYGEAETSVNTPIANRKKG